MVADAKVNLTEESKGLSRESRSDRGGSFLFPAINAGVYSVRVEKRGFSPEQIEGLKIEIGQHASMVISLRLEELRTRITVKAPTTVELDAETNARGSVIDSERVRGATAEWPQSPGVGRVGRRRDRTQPQQSISSPTMWARLSARLFYLERFPTR